MHYIKYFLLQEQSLVSQETPQAQARRIFGTYDPEGNMKFYPKPELDVCLKMFS